MATLATLSLCSYHFNSPVPNHAPIRLIPPLPFILLVLFVVTSCCCCCCRLPLNGICRLCVTHAGHYPFYRCLPFPVKFETLLWVPPATPPPSQPAACLLPLPLLASCLWPSLKSWHAACLTKSFFRLPFVLCSFDLASHTHAHTHTLAYVCFMANKILLAFLPVSFLHTLSNFDGLGRVSFPSAFFRGNLIYACKSSWQAALSSLGKLKSSARVFVRMLIVCLASRLSREKLYSETYSQLPISLCLPCKAEEHVFQLARPVFVYFLVYLSTAWQFYRFTCMHEFQYAFFRIFILPRAAAKEIR